MYEDAEALLDTVVDRTAGALQAMAGVDIEPSEALWMLVSAYVCRAHIDNPMNTAAAYAVALHRLVANRARIAELEDQVAMLQQLDEIREL